MRSNAVMESMTLGRELNPRLARCYAPEAIARSASLLGALDRETHSSTRGSFDRDHWCWKFRDFPLGMLQAAVYPLALLWRFALPDNPYHRNTRLQEWIGSAIEATLARQHRNGAFSAFCPNEQDPMSTLGIMHGLGEAVYLMRPSLDGGLSRRFDQALRKACDFCVARDETHAFVSNHCAMFAVTFQLAYELLGDERYRDRAGQIVEQIIQRQSADGWYREYEGPDPGYESLGIFYLALYWKRTRCQRLLESLRRSVEFYSYCVHPDGSVGGGYGSRHTSLYFPGGFEMLAAEVPLAASVAGFMRDRLGRRNVVTPIVCDIENLPPLASGYLEACLTEGAPAVSLPPPLPCETLDGVRHFGDAALTVAGRQRYYAVINASKGGVCRIFDKQSCKLAYEDAGYVVRAGRRRWSSQWLGLGSRLDGSDEQVVCSSRLAEVRQEAPTPGRYLVLRLLNLTVFRSAAMGNWLRRLIVEWLITKRHPGPLLLTRTIALAQNEVRFSDILQATQAVRLDDVALPRTFTAIHMGSAKYFHPAELEPTPSAPARTMLDALNRCGSAQLEFHLRFKEAASVELCHGTSEVGAVCQPEEAVAQR